MVVYKYALMPWTTLMLNADSKPLTVAEQNGEVVLWVTMPVAGPVVPRLFRCVGTGEDIEDGATYIGTAFVGDLVWHVFEVVPA